MDHLTNLPAVDGLESFDEARVVLFQSGRLVHMPLSTLQAHDADLAALAALNTTGLLRRTGDGEWETIPYAVGTWTPTIVGSTTPGTYTYTARSGSYTRIGNLVTVWFEITVNAVSVAGTGSVEISGLPLSSAGAPRMGGTVAVAGGIASVPANFSGWALASSTGASSGRLTLRWFSSLNGNIFNAPIGSIGVGTSLHGSITYAVT